MQGLSPDFSRACPAGLFLLMAGLLRPVPVQGWSPQGCFPQGLSCPGLALLRAALMAVPVELLSSGPVLVRAALLRACPVQGCSSQGCSPQGLSSQGCSPSGLSCSGLLSSGPVLFRLLSSGPVLFRAVLLFRAALLRACPVQNVSAQGLFLFTFNDRSLEQHDRQQIKFKTSLSAK